MKRSRTVALTLMTTTSLTLTACGDGPISSDETARIFHTVDACAAEDAFTREDCEDARAKAFSEHEYSAPRYDNARDCEEEFGIGSCESNYRNGTGRYWMPYFSGWAMAAATDPTAASDTTETTDETRRHHSFFVVAIYNRAGSSAPSTAAGSAFTRAADGSYKVDRNALTKPPAVAQVKRASGVSSRGGLTRSSGSPIRKASSGG